MIEPVAGTGPLRAAPAASEPRHHRSELFPVLISARLPAIVRWGRCSRGPDAAGVIVPEQLATSRLAGMPPITAFYAFIAGSVMFALLGSNPQMSVGADSTIAPLFAVGISHLAATGSPHYVDLVGILAVMVGVIVALVGLLRLGWIAEFLSAPIITGFLAGVAVIIVVHQLPDLFGLASVSGSTFSPDRDGNAKSSVT